VAASTPVLQGENVGIIPLSQEAPSTIQPQASNASPSLLNNGDLGDPELDGFYADYRAREEQRAMEQEEDELPSLDDPQVDDPPGEVRGDHRDDPPAGGPPADDHRDEPPADDHRGDDGGQGDRQGEEPAEDPPELEAPAAAAAAVGGRRANAINANLRQEIDEALHQADATRRRVEAAQRRRDARTAHRAPRNARRGVAEAAARAAAGQRGGQGALGGALLERSNYATNTVASLQQQAASLQGAQSEYWQECLTAQKEANQSRKRRDANLEVEAYYRAVAAKENADRMKAARLTQEAMLRAALAHEYAEHVEVQNARQRFNVICKPGVGREYNVTQLTMPPKVRQGFVTMVRDAQYGYYNPLPDTHHPDVPPSPQPAPPLPMSPPHGLQPPLLPPAASAEQRRGPPVDRQGDNV